MSSIVLLELKEFLQELVEFRTDSPIGYERGKNIPPIKRILNKIDAIYEEEKKIIIDTYVLKDEDGNPVLYDSVAPDSTGNQIPVKKYDFGPNTTLANKLLDELWISTYVKDSEGNPIKVDIDIFQAKPENAVKLKAQNFSGLAYALEFMGI